MPGAHLLQLDNQADVDVRLERERPRGVSETLGLEVVALRTGSTRDTAAARPDSQSESSCRVPRAALW
jgi:hypothetical protein